MTSPARAHDRRASGLLLAALLAVAQGSAWLHAASVVHVTCLEHGESIHSAFAQDVAADGDHAPKADRLEAAEVSFRGHEHCAGGALLRWRDAALTAPPATAAPTVAGAPSPAPVSACLDDGGAVYLLAPKTSPPTASA